MQLTHDQSYKWLALGTLLSHVDIATPMYETIIGCLDKAEVEALIRPTQSAARNFQAAHHSSQHRGS